MRALTDAELLGVWEGGLGQPAVQFVLSLLAVAETKTSVHEWAASSVGYRDASLLLLRERMFGPKLVGLAVCPACGEQAELDFDVSQILAEPPADAPEPLELVDADCRLRFRLPNSLDLAAIEREGSVDDARTTLLARCLLSAERRGEPLAADQFPPELASVVAQRMAAADPQADVRLDCTCPQCGQSWQAVFDIVSFFWTEICTWAKRTLREIHVLASAYGWREVDILALGPTRRRIYLGMIGDE